MKKLLARITRRGGETPPSESAAPQEMPEGGLPTESAPCGTTEAAPKPPPELPLFFMLSHLDDDGPVRLDGVKLGVCEVMGLEIDEPKLGAFAGALNALDFPAQLLVRQHPPRLERLRENLKQAQPADLPPQTRAASESLRRLLSDLEARDGILDRRFYAVCEFARVDDLRGLLASFILATQSLAKLDDLSRTMRDTLLANVGCLAVFQVAGSDARHLVWELGKDRVTEEDIVSPPVHHCYVRATVGTERMDSFSMEVRKPEGGRPGQGGPHP